MEAGPANKRQKKSVSSVGETKTADTKAADGEFDPTSPLVSLPPDALTAVLCRSPASDHAALWRTCKTIRSTLDSDSYASERVTSGYAEVEACHVPKEELWQIDFGDEPEHNSEDEEYDAEESARLKEEEMARHYSDLGSRDETYGYQGVRFDVLVDGRRQGSIHLVLVPRVGRMFHEAADAHSDELQEVGFTLCDDRGRPKVKSIKDADAENTAGKGGFLHVISARVAQSCRPSDNTDVSSNALRMAITHPKLQGKWTLATSIADANAYFTKADKKFREQFDPLWRRRNTPLTDEEEAAEKEKLRRWEECMKLDSITFLRIGYQQIPEVLGEGSRANWFFALPSFLDKPMFSHAEASEIDLFKCPELPPRPKGADEKLLNLMMRECNNFRASLDSMHRLLKKVENDEKEMRLKLSSARRVLDEQEERLNRSVTQRDEILRLYQGEDREAMDDDLRERLEQMEKIGEELDASRTEMSERRAAIDAAGAEIDEAISKSKDAILKEHSPKGHELKEKILALIQNDGASVRKSFALHCAARFRLNDYFDLLLDLIPADERKVAINETDFAGCTPLFTAAQSVPDDISQANEQYAFVEKMLKLGADKNHVDIKGLTAVGMYRTSIRSKEDFRAMLNSFAGRSNDDDEEWAAIHEQMEELLMPAAGETEADRNAKRSNEPEYDWDDEDDDDDDDEEEEDDDDHDLQDEGDE